MCIHYYDGCTIVSSILVYFKCKVKKNKWFKKKIV